MGAFETLRKIFLAELAKCRERQDAYFFAGQILVSDIYPHVELVSHMAAIAQLKLRPMEGRWVCQNEIRYAGKVHAQIFTKGETKVIWLEPDTGYYIEFELDSMPVRSQQ